MGACEEQHEKSGTTLQEHHHNWIPVDMVAPKWAKIWVERLHDKGGHGLMIWEQGCKQGFPQSDLFLALITLFISPSVRTKPTMCALKNPAQYTTFSVSGSFAFELYSLFGDTTVLVVGSYLARNRGKGKNFFLANIIIFKVLMLPLFNLKSLKYK